MPDDADALLGDLIRRLSLTRIEFEDQGFDRIARDLLRSLAVAALREAERRAGLPAPSRRRREGGNVVIPFPRRIGPVLTGSEGND